MDFNITLQQPERLQLEVNNRKIYGYNQEWYPTEWQRLAGCGPTTATQLLTYTGLRDGYLDPSEYQSVPDAVKAMEKVWRYVRPRHGGGLFKTRWFEEGVRHFVADKTLPYEVEMMRIYPFKVGHPPVEEVGTFIFKGLEQDCPVAFLNRNRGKEKGLETWHWVPIVGLQKNGEEYRGTVYDDEQVKEFSLTNWLRDTTLGGGFVYVSAQSAH